MENIQDAIQNAKESMPNLTPTPPGFKDESSVHDLKARLEWGEPALTILDVSDRDRYNRGHITGAMPMPLEQLVDSAKSIDTARDIYVYGATDAETVQAVTQLKEAGFRNVARLSGGLDAWKAIAGSTEGTEEISVPGSDAYNVVSRLAQHQQLQKK